MNPDAGTQSRYVVTGRLHTHAVTVGSVAGQHAGHIHIGLRQNLISDWQPPLGKQLMGGKHQLVAYDEKRQRQTGSIR